MRFLITAKLPPLEALYYSKPIFSPTKLSTNILSISTSSNHVCRPGTIVKLTTYVFCRPTLLLPINPKSITALNTAKYNMKKQTNELETELRACVGSGGGSTWLGRVEFDRRRLRDNFVDVVPPSTHSWRCGRLVEHLVTAHPFLKVQRSFRQTNQLLHQLLLAPQKRKRV